MLNRCCNFLNMPVTCIVVGCGSRGDRDTVKFFRIPTVLQHRFLTEKNELSIKRRALWLTAIKRNDLTETKIKFQRVCSRHFISGKPAALEDQSDPDWVPSQFMELEVQHLDKRPICDESNYKLKKRRILWNKDDDDADSQIDIQEQQEEKETGLGNIADLSINDIKTEPTLTSIPNLKYENFPFGLMNDKSNIDKWTFYTCFTYEFVSSVLFPFVESYIPSTCTTLLDPFNQLLLVLIKLRLNLEFEDLAFMFNISPPTASKYFTNVIEVLFERLKALVSWPDQSTKQKNVPLCFEQVFENKTTVIIDYLEVFFEKHERFSPYKQHHTVKFLIGITPQGSICYFSEAWGRRASLRQILEGSDLCDKLNPGDIILTGSEYFMKESNGVTRTDAMISAKCRNQLIPIKFEESKYLTQVTIHVQKLIGILKDKFLLFRNAIPMSMFKKGDAQFNMLDKIIVICSALVNLSLPVFPPL